MENNFRRSENLEIYFLVRFLFRFVALLLTFLLTVCLASAGEPVDDLQRDLKDLSLEELMKVEVATVYGASKYEQKVTEAPSSVSIVTADEIKKYGYRTIADILRSLRSFHVTYDRNYSYLGIRGFGRTGDYNSRFLILIDGHRINDNVYDSTLIETGFILDVDLIDRIEVIRGPGSSLYGSNAFLGVLNIITKKGQHLSGVEVSGEAGSFDAYKGRLSLGNRFDNGLEIILSGSIFDSQGQDLFFKEFDDPANNHGISQGCDYDRNYNLFSKLSFLDFTIEGAHVSRTKGIPTAAFSTDFNDPRNRTIDELGYLDLRYEHDFRDKSRIMARLFYDVYEYKGDYIYAGIVNKDFTKGEWWGGEAMLSKTLLERHRLILGAEYQKNSRQNQRNVNEDPFEVLLDDRRKSERWALYLQDEFTILENLIFNAGVRYDRYDNFGGSTNPRLALIYHPFETSTFKLLYGSAFRIPNVFELYYTVFPMKGNPDLEPEEIKTYELVYEHYFGKAIHTTLTGFYNKITNLIDSTIDPADDLLVFRNAGEVEMKGFEAELGGKWESGLEGRISYSYQDIKNKQNDETPVNSPRHLAKLNLIVPLIHDKVFTGMEVQYTSMRKTLADRYTGDFFVANVTVFSQKLLKGLEVSGSVYNLFDKKYEDPGSGEHLQDSIEQDGRNYRIKLTYQF
ncbi:MAG TPA: TonB-dependent receptor [Thermodesulfovibrionales bacterium]|nr:TonB-dependent receptor [Thermodesulfovibrionales bacterium]